MDYERDWRLQREREERERCEVAERQRIHEERLLVEKAKVKRLKTEITSAPAGISGFSVNALC